ncbi:hypothetical protein, partial [Flavobacterium sp.]|uniref:hypothetical protein n=1 Tax=Flavobacterium sp. TaxID=239 RepID=UPI002B4B0C37
MHKKIIFTSLLFIISILASAKPLSYYLLKYNLPANVNVLSVLEQDCVNCHYGFSSFLKQHKGEFDKENFVFLF